MEEAGEPLSSIKRYRRPRHFNWDGQPQRPSAYTYYRKLVQDFESLEDELDEAKRARDELESTLREHNDKAEVYEQRKHEAELQEWARERERRLEVLCEKQAVVSAIKKEHAELEDQEIRLQAQLEVLQEMQQQANETEAKRIRDLVHAHTSLLDKQLEKGKLDMEFLTSIVSRQKPNGTNNSNALHSVVESIQQRRQVALKEANAQFQARLLSFEKEKEDLRKKADDIKWKKQRVLQILSSNQQDVIKGFFTTPREAIQEANPPLPSLEFEEIVQAMKQSGDAVSRLQDVENEKQSGRRTLKDALKDAARHVEVGPERLVAIEKIMKDRQLEALRLNAVPASDSHPGATAYDKRWSIETYRQDQYGLVYSMRGLVLNWMERAVSISLQQPAKQVLELEVRRFDETRSKLMKRQEAERQVLLVAQIVHEMEREVIRDLAESIFNEFSYSTASVHHVFESEIKNVLFSENITKPANRKPPNNAQESSLPSLRWELLTNTWKELRQGDQTNQFTQSRTKLLMRPAERKPVSVISTNATQQNRGHGPTTGASSPTKKRFGMFGTKSRGTPSEIEVTSDSHGAASIPERSFPSADTSIQIPVTFTLLQADLSAGRHGAEQRDNEIEQFMWQRVSVTSTQFASLASHGLVTCVELSDDGKLLAAGTLDGGIVVYSLSNAPPVVICATLQSKSVTRDGDQITRLCFSPCGTRLLSYNQAKAATVWSLAPLDVPSSHSSDCFPSEFYRRKHPALYSVKQFKPSDVFEEPILPAQVSDKDTVMATARIHTITPMTVCAIRFFSSTSLIGEPTHVLCCSSTGDIVKLLVEARSGVSSRSILGLHNEAEFDAPRAQDHQLKFVATDGALNTREFFRHGHRQPILFVSTLPCEDPMQPVRIISIDQGGRVVLWMYSRAFFRRFGWFEPHRIYQLDLSFTFTTITRGDILQIKGTGDGRRLVLMLYATTSQSKALGGRLRFEQLDLVGADISVLNVPLEIEFVGPIPPRFSLLGFHDRSKAGKRSTEIRWFLALLMNNAIHLYSLQTGSIIHAPIQLDNTGTTKPGRATSKESSLHFNSITCASTNHGIRTTKKSPIDESILVLAGEQHKQVRLYRFSLSN